MYLAIKEGVYRGVYLCEDYSDVKLLFDKMYLYPEFKIYKNSEIDEALFWVGRDEILPKLRHIEPNEKTKDFLSIIKRAAETGTHMTITFLDGSDTTIFIKDVCLINTKKVICYDNSYTEGYRIRSSDDFANPNTFFHYMKEFIDKTTSTTKSRKELIKEYIELYQENFSSYPWYTYETSCIGVWGDFVSVEGFKELKHTETQILEKIGVTGNKIFNINAVKDIHVFSINVIAKDKDFLEVVKEIDRKVI